MAKGVGLLGNIKGKLGNVVGYQIRNSNNRTSQGWRVYQPEVANPKTSAQAVQRMKIAPAVLFYRAFSGLLDHSWEGIKYGGDSHQYFMKIVMRNTFEGFPFLPLGTTFMVPGNYPVSRGSIVGFDVTSFSDGQAITNVRTSFAAGSTLGEVSAALIADNPQLKDGDQLTLVWVEKSGNANAPYMPGYTRLILDTTSPVLLSDTTAYHYFNWDTDAYMKIAGDGGTIVAAAVIVSRLSDGDWLRSTANLVCNLSDTDLADYFTEQQRVFARKTYEENIAITSSKWYLNQASNSTSESSGSNGGGNGGALVVSAAMLLANGTTVQAAYYNGQERQGFLLHDAMPETIPGGGSIINGKAFTLEGSTLTEDATAKSISAPINSIEITEVQAELTAAGYSVVFTTGE